MQMPWSHMRDEDACPASEPWAVRNDDTGGLVACHATEQGALDHVAALYANVEDAGKGGGVTEHKSYPIAEFKALNGQDEAGSFEAVVSVFGTVDYGGDRVQKGAFRRTLQEWGQKGRAIPVLWSHDAETPPIGVVTEAKENNEGLRIKARLLVDDNPQAKAIHAAMKAGALHEFSFGYGVRQSEDVTENGQPVRVLKDLDLFEASPVFRGMNPDTRLVGVKQLPPDAKGELADIAAELAETHRKLDALSAAQSNVAVKALADAISGGLAGLEQDEHDGQGKQGEQDDNPEPNPTDVVGEEAKARIRRLLVEKPIHQETDDEHEDEPSQGEAG